MLLSYSEGELDIAIRVPTQPLATLSPSQAEQALGVAEFSSDKTLRNRKAGINQIWLWQPNRVVYCFGLNQGRGVFFAM